MTVRGGWVRNTWNSHNPRWLRATLMGETVVPSVYDCFGCLQTTVLYMDACNWTQIIKGAMYGVKCPQLEHLTLRVRNDRSCPHPYIM
jgi:hypothetical protein